MLHTSRASRGMVVAPHHLAAESGLADTLGQLGRAGLTDFYRGGIARSMAEDLRRAGHRVEITRAFDSTMGHAGALVLHPNGVIEGASDPRSDGSTAGF